jgi:hypothetical protein
VLFGRGAETNVVPFLCNDNSNLRFLGCDTKNVRPHVATFVAQLQGCRRHDPFNNLASRRDHEQRAERDGQRSYNRNIITRLPKDIYDNYSFAYTGSPGTGHDNALLRTRDSTGQRLKHLQLEEGEGNWTGRLMDREGRCLSKSCSLTLRTLYSHP